MVVGLQQVVGVDMGGEIGSDELRILTARLRCSTIGSVALISSRDDFFLQRKRITTYHNRAFTPTAIPVS